MTQFSLIVKPKIELHLNTRGLIVWDVPNFDGFVGRAGDQAIGTLAGEAHAVDTLVVRVQRPDGLVVHAGVDQVDVALVSSDLSKIIGFYFYFSNSDW